MQNCCAGAGIDLIDQLANASDHPRNPDGGLKRSGLPYFFKTWAPIAWADLRDSLPDEESADELSDHAMEEFRSKVTAAMLTPVTLGRRRKKDGPQERECRTLADWCKIFAKPGVYRDIRSYRIWAKLDRGDKRLRIALRSELFGQLVGGSDLARLHYRKFADLAKQYEVGTGTKVSGGKTRAVELAQDFIQDLFAKPLESEDEQTDGETHARAREDSASV